MLLANGWNFFYFTWITKLHVLAQIALGFLSCNQCFYVVWIKLSLLDPISQKCSNPSHANVLGRGCKLMEY